MKKAQTFCTMEKTSKADLLEKGLKEIRKTAVYVGIAKGADQEYRKGEPISNSDLGFIHEKGSPANRIPPRPFLVPGVASVKDSIKPVMQKAAKAALNGDIANFDKLMERIALKAQVAVPNYVKTHQGDFVPLKPKTIEARKRKIKAVRGIGSNITILMDTGQLVGAIRGVVVKDKK